MQEIYKDIPWYEWLYEVSSIWNVKRISKIWIRNRIVNERILIPQKSHLYLRVNLSKNWKSKLFLISRLVAQAFLWLNMNDRKAFVCHKDDNPKNNHLSNLFIGTPKDNTQDMIMKNRNKVLKWEKNWSAKINESIVLQIRKLFNEWTKQFILSDSFWISRATINYIVHRKLWKHI